MVPKFSYKGGGVFIWFLQRLSGIILLVLLITHFFYFHLYLHFIGEEFNFAEVSGRLVSPFWKTFDVLFLFSAVFHGLNGAWMIASDYLRKDWLKVAVLSAIITLGAVLTILGLLTIVPFKG